MSIRRGVRPADHFTIVSNGFARDSRLTFKARGIGLYLLSHAEGFRSTAASIAHANGCGEDQVYAGLKELQTLGYLRRDRERDERGRVGGADYVITDHVDPHLLRETPTGQTPTGKTRVHKKTNSTEDQKTEDVTPSPTAAAVRNAQPDPGLALPGMPPAPVKTRSKPGHDEADAVFDQWWTAYPRKVEKRAARKAWDKVLREHRTDPETLILEAKRYADVFAGSRFIKHPGTWLNGDCWLDELVTPSDLVAASNKHTPYSDDPNADYTGAMT